MARRRFFVTENVMDPGDRDHPTSGLRPVGPGGEDRATAVDRMLDEADALLLAVAALPFWRIFERRRLQGEWWKRVSAISEIEQREARRRIRERDCGCGD